MTEEVASPPREGAQKVAAGVRVMTAASKNFDVPYHQRVLVDSGANELIRPFSRQWWTDMEHKKCKGTKVVMKLAGNVLVPGYMTGIGEVMMQENPRKHDYDITWILPVNRLQEELEVEVRWRADGTAALYFPDGKVVELIRQQGLSFIDYEDFMPIRQQLAVSHQKGRPTACPRTRPPQANVVTVSLCEVSTQTEGPKEQCPMICTSGDGDTAARTIAGSVSEIHSEETWDNWLSLIHI